MEQFSYTDAGEQNLIWFVPAGQMDEARAKELPGLREMELIDRREGGGSTRFESREGYDYFSVLVVSPTAPDAEPCRVQAYFAPARLTFIYEEIPAMEELIVRLREEPMPAGQAMLLFFYFLTQHDNKALLDFEEEISDFEDLLADDDVPKDTSKHISVMRKRLLQLKRYYEALFDLLEDMEENANGLLGKKQLHALHLQTNRADRLNRAVLNLRDYVTQVRESYQAQLDIEMNKTMKLFTVVTVIFMPLTLVVGWYGMNLMMPEYAAPWMYPVVIAVNLVVVVGCIVYFKRRKWF